MKFNRFLMYGMIIFGVLMIMGSASAVTITGVTPESFNLYTPTVINVTLDANDTNVTLSGAGISESDNSGANTWVAFTVTATETGLVTVTADNGTTDTETITAGSTRRSRRYMAYTVSPEAPAPGEEVTLTVVDKVREDGIEEVEVDIFYQNKKYAYGVTDDDGIFTFTPVQAGDYSVDLDRTNYRPVDFTITVSGDVVTTTTTTEAVVTTTEAAVTTTEAEVTTTEAEVTTTEAEVTTTVVEVTTTEAEATTTTTLAEEEPAEGGLPMLWIGIIVVILIVVVYFVAVKGKGGEAAEAPAEEAPAAEETKEE